MNEHDERLPKPVGAFQQQVAPGVRVTYEADRIVDRARHDGRETLLIDNEYFGRLMFVDGALRSSSADEFIYHEMMSHVPILGHGKVERVLIVGGADFGLAEEVLKHRGVRRLVQVDSDRQTQNLARSHFAGVNGPVFEDGRFELIAIAEAQFLTTTDERFDVILADIPDPLGMEISPLTQEFFRAARSCLTPGGLLVSRLVVPFLHPLVFSVAIKRLSAVFPYVTAYLVPVPSSLGGPVAIGWASNVLRPDEPAPEVLASRYTNAFIGTYYYTPEVHRAAFALPQYLRDSVTAATRPDEEERVVRPFLRMS
jgi:spermidine synthase